MIHNMLFTCILILCTHFLKILIVNEVTIELYRPVSLFTSFIYALSKLFHKISMTVIVIAFFEGVIFYLIFQIFGINI